MRQERDDAAARAKSAAGAELDALKQRLDGLDRATAKLTSQIGHVVAQIDELNRQVARCPGPERSTPSR
jgi:hypothetical protein